MVRKSRGLINIFPSLLLIFRRDYDTSWSEICDWNSSVWNSRQFNEDLRIVSQFYINILFLVLVFSWSYKLYRNVVRSVLDLRNFSHDPFHIDWGGKNEIGVGFVEESDEWITLCSTDHMGWFGNPIVPLGKLLSLNVTVFSIFSFLENVASITNMIRAIERYFPTYTVSLSIMSSHQTGFMTAAPTTSKNKPI